MTRERLLRRELCVKTPSISKKIIGLATHELKRSVDQDTMRHVTYAIAHGGIVISWAVRDW